MTRHHITSSPAGTARAAAVFATITCVAAASGVALLEARPIAVADTASSEGLLLATAWWLAFALFAWLAATAVASWCARTIGAWRGASWLDIATLPIVRRLLDRALAVTIVTSAVVPMAARAASAAAPRIAGSRAVAAAPLVRRHAPPDVRRHAEPQVRRHAGPDVRRHAEPQVRRHAEPLAQPLAAPPIVRGSTSTTTSPTPVTPPVTATPPTPPTRAPRGIASGQAHVVVRDDNLWTIAAAELASHGTAADDDAAVERYWRRVIARNRAHLRSRDANLIFPGEVIWLPPVDRAG